MEIQKIQSLFFVLEEIMKLGIFFETWELKVERLAWLCALSGDQLMEIVETQSKQWSCVVETQKQ